MNNEIEAQGRRITLIFDPHIKVADDYFVHKEGIELQYLETETNISNIFVRSNRGSPDPFYGDCWPGNSTWIDFLNENAQEFWGSLFSFEKFKGSNYMYSAWNDMNEPAVFSTPTKTMPLTNIHVKADGSMYEYRDIRNAYGALQ